MLFVVKLYRASVVQEDRATCHGDQLHEIRVTVTVLFDPCSLSMASPACAEDGLRYDCTPVVSLLTLCSLWWQLGVGIAGGKY